MGLSNLDRELLRDCLAGSEAAWRGFCDRYIGLIIHTVDHVATSFRIPLDAPSRDDLVSDVFVALLDRDCATLRHFRGDSSLAAYLVVIARRTAIKKLSVRTLPMGSNAEIESIPDSKGRSSPSSPSVDWDSPETFQGLSHEEVSAIRMFHLEGKSYREIGSHLGLSENSIGPFLTRAREKLRHRA